MALERHEDRLLFRGGDAGAEVDDADLGAAGELAGGKDRAPGAGPVAQRVEQQVHHDALHQHRVRGELVQVLRHVHLDVGGPQPGLLERGQQHVLDGDQRHVHAQHARLQPRDIQQVGDQDGERVQGLVGGLQQLGPVLLAVGDLGGTQRGHGGGRGRERAAQVVPDGLQQGAADPVRLRQRGQFAGGGGDGPEIQHGLQLGDDRRERAPVRGGQVPPVELERRACPPTGSTVPAGPGPGVPAAWTSPLPSSKPHAPQGERLAGLVEQGLQRVGAAQHGAGDGGQQRRFRGGPGGGAVPPGGLVHHHGDQDGDQDVQDRAPPGAWVRRW